MFSSETDQSRWRSSPRWLRFSLSGLMFLVLCVAGVLGGMRWGLARLQLSPDPLVLNVVQRKSTDIPGLRGLARIQLGDITDAQVELSVHDDQSQLLFGPTSVRVGDVSSFPLRGQTFYIRLDQLVNNLIGEDHAVVRISSQKLH